MLATYYILHFLFPFTLCLHISFFPHQNCSIIVSGFTLDKSNLLKALLLGINNPIGITFFFFIFASHKINKKKKRKEKRKERKKKVEGVAHKQTVRNQLLINELTDFLKLVGLWPQLVK